MAKRLTDLTDVTGKPIDLSDLYSFKHDNKITMYDDKDREIRIDNKTFVPLVVIYDAKNCIKDTAFIERNDGTREKIFLDEREVKALQDIVDLDILPVKDLLQKSMLENIRVKVSLLQCEGDYDKIKFPYTDMGVNISLLKPKNNANGTLCYVVEPCFVEDGVFNPAEASGDNSYYTSIVPYGDIDDVMRVIKSNFPDIADLSLLKTEETITRLFDEEKLSYKTKGKALECADEITLKIWEYFCSPSKKIDDDFWFSNLGGLGNKLEADNKYDFVASCISNYDYLYMQTIAKVLNIEVSKDFGEIKTDCLFLNEDDKICEIFYGCLLNYGYKDFSEEDFDKAYVIFKEKYGENLIDDYDIDNFIKENEIEFMHILCKSEIDVDEYNEWNKEEYEDDLDEIN